MKNKEIIIDKSGLERSIDMLTGNNIEYFLIDKNLFSINKISTILKPTFKTSQMLNDRRMIIEFAYADKVLPMDVKIILCFNDVSCLEFVKSSQMINESQFNSVVEKVFACYKENYSYDDEKLKQIIDDIALNETILILTQALNKDDCESAKNDFISKFETWKKRRTDENEVLEKLMNDLFVKLISMKVWKKSQI